MFPGVTKAQMGHHTTHVEGSPGCPELQGQLFSQGFRLLLWVAQEEVKIGLKTYESSCQSTESK